MVVVRFLAYSIHHKKSKSTMKYRLFLYQCIRSKEVRISLVLITVLGLVGILIGNRHLIRQQEAIAESDRRGHQVLWQGTP